MYGRTALKHAGATASEDIDLIKIQIHKLIDEMSIYDDAGFLSVQALAMCRELFRPDVGRGDIDEFVRTNDAAISSLVKRLGIESDLARRNDDADLVMSSALVRNLEPRFRNAILTGYLGYFYWDIILHPAVSALSLETGSIEEILVDRISPDDAACLAASGGARVLLGGTFAGFGGFLSRATRENDYLWGRLHAVERLFDILATTVPASTREAIDFRALKLAAFERVTEEEAGRLSLIPDLVANLRAAIAAL